MNNEDQSAINVLLQEKDGLLREVEYINRLIERIKLRSGSPSYVQPPASQPNNSNGVNHLPSYNANGSYLKPKASLAKAPFEQRIRTVFEEVIKHPVRFPELKVAFEDLKLPVGNLRHDTSELRRKGILVAIKFNNNATSVYIGPKDWVVEADFGPTFKEEFFNPVVFVPNGIFVSEIASFNTETKKQEGHPEG
ncbi:hypothetical protein GCM10027592_29600 [Spirosoma flavus]